MARERAPDTQVARPDQVFIARAPVQSFSPTTSMMGMAGASGFWLLAPYALNPGLPTGTAHTDQAVTLADDDTGPNRCPSLRGFLPSRPGDQRRRQVGTGFGTEGIPSAESRIELQQANRLAIEKDVAIQVPSMPQRLPDPPSRLDQLRAYLGDRSLGLAGAHRELSLDESGAVVAVQVIDHVQPVLLPRQQALYQQRLPREAPLP